MNYLGNENGKLKRKPDALKAQNNIAQGKRSGALGNVGNNVGALQGQFIIIFYELRLQRAINGGFTNPTCRSLRSLCVGL
jgi:hypothetical protein